MNAASPGVIALFQPNRYYPDHETYLEAIAAAMAAEYRAIVDAGLVLQLDSPDLGLGRHMMFKDNTDAEYRALAELHVDALNHALADIPADRVRLHVCWGNYEGPHHRDAPLSMVLPIALRRQRRRATVRVRQPPARPRVANAGRHAHSRRSHPDTGRDRFDHELHRTPGTGLRAPLPFRRHRRARAGDCWDGLWIFDVCGVWGRRPPTSSMRSSRALRRVRTWRAGSFGDLSPGRKRHAGADHGTRFEGIGRENTATRRADGFRGTNLSASAR